MISHLLYLIHIMICLARIFQQLNNVIDYNIMILMINIYNKPSERIFLTHNKYFL